jgi:hypothetical protein
MRQWEKRLRNREKRKRVFKFDTEIRRLVEETEAHVLIGLLLLLNLLLSLGLGGGVSSGATSRGSGSGASGADVGQELLDVLTLEGPGEDGRPDGLNLLDLSGRDEGLDLVGLK